MNSLFWTIILSILPLSELRGGIIYALSKGIFPPTAFFIATISNIIIIPFIFLFLDYLNNFFMKFRPYSRFFNYILERKIKKITQRHATLSYFILFVFVAIPSPGTGAYTGCLLSWFFKLNKTKSIAVIALGVIVAGILTTLISITGFSLYKLFFLYKGV